MKKLIIIAACTLISATASAQPIGGTDLFALLDVDANHMISEEEASIHEPVLAQFQALDVNKDGQLSTDEFDMLAKG
ncbi:hypothetical protein [Neptunomonas antarctica]|uniref:EF hand n=1 Tax=Neptunomonas antarctica TaxID=619304 RepID=A0A1N7PAL2_9GAMM|nr:hypothetical protein [Neptunomonas antarctica]SIT07588.1 EF hand [Neptunomonas antarctica]